MRAVRTTDAVHVKHIGQRIFRGIIWQTIKDLVSNDQQYVSKATRYIGSSFFLDHLKYAGYPSELQTALLETLNLSSIQQRHIVRQLLDILQKEMPLAERGIH